MDLKDLNLTPEELDALMELANDPDKLDEITRLHKENSYTRHQPGPGMINAGRVSVAASPLEFVGDLGQKYAAMQSDKALQKQMAEILRKSAESRKMYAQKYFGDQDTSQMPEQYDAGPF